MGGRSGVMQRSSNSTVRTIMALCLGSLVVVTVLYLAKRVEVNKTLKELDMVKMENRDVTGSLNAKIGEYVDKIETLTQEATVVGGQLNKCKDERDSVIEQGEDLKSDKEKCSKELATAQQEKEEIQAALNQAKSERDTANSEREDTEEELQESQEENANLQSQLDQCESDNDQLHSQFDARGMCSAELATVKDKLRRVTENEEILLKQVEALEGEKKDLEAKLAQRNLQPPNALSQPGSRGFGNRVQPNRLPGPGGRLPPFRAFPNPPGQPQHPPPDSSEEQEQEQPEEAERDGEADEEKEGYLTKEDREILESIGKEGDEEV